jgi:hypothetical protein
MFAKKTAAIKMRMNNPILLYEIEIETKTKLEYSWNTDPISF